VTDGQTDRQTELRWLRRAESIAAFACKNGDIVFQVNLEINEKSSLPFWTLKNKKNNNNAKLGVARLTFPGCKNVLKFDDAGTLCNA